VLKPPAGSFGRDVFVVTPQEPNLDALLALLTGHGSGRYCLLQRWLPEVSEGEHRVLVAAGRVIAGYRRLPASGASNLSRGNRAEPAALTRSQRALAEAVAAELLVRGIGFAGLDLAGEWLLEVNVANPGGLGTLRTLTQIDYAHATAEAVLAWSARQRE